MNNLKKPKSENVNIESNINKNTYETKHKRARSKHRR